MWIEQTQSRDQEAGIPLQEDTMTDPKQRVRGL